MNKRIIISGYAAYDFLKTKFPNRPIEISVYPDAHTFYWFNKHGEVRIGNILDGSIHVLVKDNDGFSTPYTTIRRFSSWLKR